MTKPKTLYAAYTALIETVLTELVAEGTLPADTSFANVTLEPPRDAAHGDLATNAAMVLAKGAGMNPRATFRNPITTDDVLNSRMIAWPFRLLMCCLVTDGGGALILTSSDRAKDFPTKPCYILGSGESVETTMVSQMEDFTSSRAFRVAGPEAFRMAGIGPEDISVAQLQDTESGAEIMHMAENGFCADGEQEAWLAEGRTEIGGALPVNTDGGCLACGEPIGASGLRQVYENVQQLRGRAGERGHPVGPAQIHRSLAGR